MRILAILGTGVILLYATSGCTSVKRYRSATFKGQDNSLVDISLCGADLMKPGPGETGRSLWDLSASAQTQMIQILNERYPENGQFTRALNQEYLHKGPGKVLDHTSRDLQMVFSVSKRRNYQEIGNRAGTFSPADRIEYLKFSLEIPPEYNLYFKGWNRYSTEYGEIEVADVSFSRSLDLEADLSTEYADGGAKASVSRSEEQEVRSRYLKLNGSLSDRMIVIEEEGARDMDLTGNVMADVSLTFDGFPERLTLPLFSEPGEGTTPAVSSLKFMDCGSPQDGRCSRSDHGGHGAGICVPTRSSRRKDIPGMGRQGILLFRKCQKAGPPV